MPVTKDTKARRKEIADQRAWEKSARVDLTEREINYLIESVNARRPWEDKNAVLIQILADARSRCD
jgi:hypothetical protein